MIADLYIRVSTDEQADKGYSQRHQEDTLRKYCEINHIEIRRVLFEDHSAKTFNRPVWKRYLLDIRKHKNIADRVLFLSIPENKMMLAFYLAVPEVENDRRALNVMDGMHRARKEGRWMGAAVFGFANRTREDGTKYIAPKEPDASVMRWAFHELARGIFNTEQVWRMAQKRGFTKKKANFWQIIRNPIYCGKIIVPKYKNEEATVVKGLHEPLISEGLFYEVQSVLNGRKRAYRTRMRVDDQIPLRGFFDLPQVWQKPVRQRLHRIQRSLLLLPLYCQMRLPVWCSNSKLGF